jgi:hypothetical protein
VVGQLPHFHSQWEPLRDHGVPGPEAERRRNHRYCGSQREPAVPHCESKIEGDKITIEVENDGNKIKLDLVLADDRITGDASLLIQGETRTAKVDVKRAK